MSLTTQNPQRTASFMVRTMLISFCFWVVGTAPAQTLTVTLTASDYNGFNVRCFGGKSGTIDATVTGGTAPYTFLWSSGQTTEDVADMPSGYYKVAVYDANNVHGDAAITLNEPEPLKVTAEALKYPTGDNISCYDCYNGSIDVTVLQGVPPYLYVWGDDVFTQDRSGLGPYSYGVTVKDLNGCLQKSEPLFLKQPDSKDWKMGGNTNINPATQYLGTNDASDLVFKSNGQEALRLESDGDIKLTGSLAGSGLLFRNADGTLKIGGGDNDFPEIQPCRGLSSFNYWNVVGNTFTSLCPDDLPNLGTLTAVPLTIITNGTSRIRVTPTGEVGIGTNAPIDRLTISGSGRPSMSLRNSSSTSGGGSILYRKGDNTITWELGTDLGTDGGQNFYIRDKIVDASRIFIDENGNVGIGTEWVPTDKLTVAGASRPSISIRTTDAGNAAGSLYYRKQDNAISWELGTDLFATGGQTFFIRDKVADVNRILIDENGRVAIGDVWTPEGYMLAVQGGIQTEKVKVSIYSQGQWNDHVFGSEYELPSLDEVSAFIKENGHLQGIPSAACMVEEGLDVAKMDAALLLKIEELTLYIVELNRRIYELELMEQK